MQIRTSELDGETIVFEIEEGDDNEFSAMLDGPRPNGFALFGPGIPIPVAVVDGRILAAGLTRDHLLAIEAHELGHIREQSIEEPVAERAACELLLNAGEHVARQILLDRGII